MTNGDKVTFTNGVWRYEVRVSGQESVNMLHNEKAIKEISSKFEDQNFKYVSFPGGPSFYFTGTMTIDVSDEMETSAATSMCVVTSEASSKRLMQW